MAEKTYDMVDRLLPLAQTLQEPSNVPLATRAAFVKRELALICKELSAAASQEETEQPKDGGQR
jgi:hypothetical protein